MWMVGEIREIMDIIKKNGDEKSPAAPALKVIWQKNRRMEQCSIIMYCFTIGSTEEKPKQTYTSKFKTNRNRW